MTCNTYIGAMNAFCRWLSEEGHVRERVKLGKLRVERRLLTLLDEAQMRALIGFKPKTFRQARVHLATLLILDTGLRISEALHLLASDIDFDNLVLKVFGKGQKERLVPFSPELRRRIYRYQQLRAKKRIAAPLSPRAGAHQQFRHQVRSCIQNPTRAETAVAVGALGVEGRSEQVRGPSVYWHEGVVLFCQPCSELSLTDSALFATSLTVKHSCGTSIRRKLRAQPTSYTL